MLQRSYRRLPFPSLQFFQKPQHRLKKLLQLVTAPSSSCMSLSLSFSSSSSSEKSCAADTFILGGPRLRLVPWFVAAKSLLSHTFDRCQSLQTLKHSCPSVQISHTFSDVKVIGVVSQIKYNELGLVKKRTVDVGTPLKMLSVTNQSIQIDDRNCVNKYIYYWKY